ncbi:MAG: CPBP family intramembrane glutamic endopeptidase, partial [Candidatus Melainabacteria bacterium]|nr:CPBP family intramembrane glutamic endopeptidase [Candidatus Melainabacteria bacterium]
YLSSLAYLLSLSLLKEYATLFNYSKHNIWQKLKLPNDRAIPSLNHLEAKALALKFLNGNSAVSIDSLKLVEDRETKKVNRTDHSFVWECNNPEFGAARARLNVSVAGNKVSNFHHYLYLPEVWKRQYQTMRTYNSNFALIACVFSLGFVVWGLYVFFRALPLHQIRWRFVFCVATLVGLASGIDALNNLPVGLSEYNPSSSFPGFLLNYFGNACGMVVVYFAIMIPLSAAAELLYRTTFPQKLALESFFNPKAWSGREMQLAITAGYAFCAISMGYQVLFYLVGKNFGFSSPLFVTHYATLATTIPALSAIAIGIMASVLEEFLFRVVGLSFGQKILKNFWAANLLQAMVWAFAHSCYAQQPAYARGLELTIDGLLFGWILKRYGLIACIVSHFLFDAFLTVQPMFSAPDAISQLSAYGTVLFLAILSCALLLRQRLSKPTDATMLYLFNSDISLFSPAVNATPVEPSNDAPIVANQMSFKVRLSLVFICSIALIIHLSAIFPSGIGYDANPVSIDRNHAIAEATAFLSKAGFKLDDKMVVANLIDGLAKEKNDISYVYDKQGFEKARAFSKKLLRPLQWKVRFFKPMDVEEYSVLLDGQGHVMSQRITKAEDAVGVTVSKTRAQELAQNYIRTVRPEFKECQFTSISETKRKNRTDFLVEFKVPEYKVREADYKLTVNVIGDQPSGLGYSLNIPDQWIFEKQKRNQWNEIGGALKALFATVCMVAALWCALRLSKKCRPSWSLIGLMAVVSVVVSLIGTLNTVPSVLGVYPTSTPLSNFIIERISFCAAQSLGALIGAAMLVIIGMASIRSLIGASNLRTVLNSLFKPQNQQERQRQVQSWIDACLIALFAFWSQNLLSNLMGSLDLKYGHAVNVQSFNNTCANANAFSGALGHLFENSWSTMLFLCIAVFLLSVDKTFGRRKLVVASLIIVYSVLCASQVHYLSSFLILTLGSVARYSLMWFILDRLMRNNAAAFLVVAWTQLPLRIFWALGLYAFPMYAFDCIFALGLAAVPFVYATILWLSEKVNLTTEKAPAPQEIPVHSS